MVRRRYSQAGEELRKCGAAAEISRLLKWREMRRCLSAERCREMFTTAETHPINNIATEHAAARRLFAMCVCVRVPARISGPHKLSQAGPERV